MRSSSLVGGCASLRVGKRCGKWLSRKERRWQASVGVDLGTCNSAIAVLENGRPKAVELSDGQYTMASSVVCTKEGLVSWTQAEKEEVASCNILSNAKRFIGRDFISVQEDAERQGFSVVEGVSQSVLFKCPALDVSITPEEVSSVVLKSLIRAAERQLDESVDRAVISIPSYFDTRQKAATLEAAGMAGVHNVILLQEPIAAALAYGFGQSSRQDLVLVVDMGGGTFDVSIVNSFEGIMEVVAYSGDPHLGGKDFDHAIADWLLNGETCISELDPIVRGHVNRIAEDLKIQLSTLGFASCTMQGRHIQLDMSTFQDVTHHLSKKFLPPIQKAGQLAMVDWMDTNHKEIAFLAEDDPFRPPPKRITQVVLAGGSSTLPSLRSLITQMTGLRDIKCKVDPKLCVAYGAAVFAGMLEGEVEGVEIMDGAYSSGVHERISDFDSFCKQ